MKRINWGFVICRSIGIGLFFGAVALICLCLSDGNQVVASWGTFLVLVFWLVERFLGDEPIFLVLARVDERGAEEVEHVAGHVALAVLPKHK